MNDFVSGSYSPDLEFVKSILLKSYVFQGASEDSISMLSEGATIRTVERSVTLFSEGDTCDYVYVLVSGHVTFFMHDEHGKRYTLGLVEEFSIFGDMEIFSKGPRMSHAEAHENSQVLCINAPKFNNVVKNDPDILYRIVRFYAALLTRLTRFSLFRDVEKQLAFILVDFARRYGHNVSLELGTAKLTKGIEIDVHLSQEFLGSLVGIPRQRINSILKKWEEKDWIRIRYSRVILLNEPALKKYSII